MDLSQLTKEERDELSLIEVAHYVLETKREVMPFQSIVDEITKFLGLSDDEMRDKLVQFYTDMNIEGNFISLGNNTWGLRAWYPIDAIDEEVQTQTKTKKRKSDDDDDEDIDEDILDDDIEYEEDDGVEELGEEEVILTDGLVDDDEDPVEDHLPDGIEGDLTTVEDDEFADEFEDDK
ncbi:DNA-directed RNA polymerase subunit delta [Listeria booriae]|uniref:Probable DNA-directed RNA polymerase subunit delta n=1 Tax=Listeria booriae TaxID=1552123 RepID=A0A099VZ37_9LIST|nr:DNA-directed RNA polymerase subunit delta [Listeria booriae]KGL38859.1 DNA-directed RNA polymerase subunit delta [Listeria booriae]MBC1211249.1 DNA-directed RNA polymerase subunit delta [Listeria booriae]MBC1227828.1 DNA-directed RNA polymerase subunit delta [Listeria booriae]MBC1230988.1 DNA-directed RNA polymerase subunit delta [Listeria booriae]MBC1235064.1 DNA-directed RNA polymerase subunit delta [Listeria booriae]